MTEKDWLYCKDPAPMLIFLAPIASDRKLRLFQCGCCRRILHLMTDERSRQAVDVAEQYADGLAVEEKRSTANGKALEASNAAKALFNEKDQWEQQEWDATAIAECAADAAHDSIWWIDGYYRRDEQHIYSIRFFGNQAADAVKFSGSHQDWLNERNAQADLLRCIHGNPFGPITMDQQWLRWNDMVVPRLAQTIYDERRFADMPILADALVDAGCRDENILSHCCQSEEHGRGCWVIDLILGKS